MRGVALAVAVLALLATGARSASVGAKVSNCDPEGPYGCPWTSDPEENYAIFDDPPRPNRLDCQQKAGRLMPWAAAPASQPDSDFTVSAGDEANPRTSYVPGEILSIRVRTHNRAKKFRGILVTPEQVSSGAARTKVGDWMLTREDPPPFTNPTMAGCEKALIHSTAAFKSANVVAKWRAPAAGTGSVVFKTLLKMGNANHGYFYKPADMTLTEGSVPSQPAAGQREQWVRGATGQSCDQACTALGGDWKCTETAFSNTDLSFMAPVFERAVCAEPYLSGCDDLGLGPKASETDNCFYHDTTICAAENRPVVQGTCSASSSDARQGQRWCPCNDAPATCVPIAVCPNPTTQCGNVPDGCGGTVSCGSCSGAGDQCINNLCTCVADTCQAKGFTCGIHDNGCGGQLDCGSCSGTDVCTNGACVAQGCTPLRTCGAQDACGTLYTTCQETGAGISFECGTCNPGISCNATSNTCNCLQECPNVATQCGTISDGCGASVNCGGCSQQHELCVNNLCSCTPHTCAEHGWTCGTHDNGCGGTVDCGSCTGSDQCSGNYQAGVNDPGAMGRCLDPGCGAPTQSCPMGGAACGPLQTTCSGSGAPLTLDCGSCRSPNSCNTQTNNCTCLAECPTGLNLCGAIDDKCGGTVQCGTCPQAQDTCNSATNVCECSPFTCLSQNWACGQQYDGCGGTLQCGNCPANSVCISGRCEAPSCGPGQVYELGACLCDTNNGYKFNNVGECVSGSEEVSLASNQSPSLLLVATAAGVALISAGKRFGVLSVIVVLSMVLSPASAHNWVNSPSRSRNANTIKPHRTGSLMPHVQANTGQMFQIEWMAAHTSSDMSIFITVAEEHEYMFNRMTPTDIQDYLDNGPGGRQGSLDKALEDNWRRYHRKGTGGNSADNDFYSDTRQEVVSGYFDSFLGVANAGGNPPYFRRPEQFDGYIRNVTTIDEPDGIQADIGYPHKFLANDGIPYQDHDNIWQARYKDCDLMGTCRTSWYSKTPDQRATYYNPSYPEIISIAVFFHGVGQFIRPDFANFEIPVSLFDAQGVKNRDLPNGRYIINWAWQGYYDSTDVDIVSVPSPVPESAMYGSPQAAGQAIWKKTTHAMYENPYQIQGGAMGVVHDVQRCKDACTSNWCSGFNVLPVRAPAGMSSDFKDSLDSRIPWDGGNPAPPGGGGSNIPRAAFDNAPDGSYFCYPVHRRRDIGANTVGELTISDDPEDPVYYAEAWTRWGGLIFDLSNSVQPQVVSRWRYGAGGCMPCHEMKQRATGYYDYAPLDVGAPEVCRDCDLEPSQQAVTTGPPTADWVRVAEHSACDGHPGIKEDADPFAAPPYFWLQSSHHSCPSGTECVKPFDIGWYRTWGRDLTESECFDLVQRDPECGNTVMFADDQSQSYQRATCMCYKDISCCNSCTRVYNWATAIYEIQPAGGWQADPNCANGVKSSDGSKCCPASCGSTCDTNWNPSTTPIGICTGTLDPSRTCANYPAPCMNPN